MGQEAPESDEETSAEPASATPSTALHTPEGVSFVPFIETTEDDGEIVDLRVGIRAHFGEHIHTVTLIPSTATDEGDGTGNVFLYEDDDPLTHLAWKH